MRTPEVISVEPSQFLFLLCDDAEHYLYSSRVSTEENRAGTLNRNAGANNSGDATAAITTNSTDTKKTWIIF